MRKILPILLSLLIWSASSGLIEIQHSHEHQGVPHEHATCHICVTLHAAMDMPAATTTQIVVQQLPWQPEIAPEVCFAHPISLVETSRGPPVF